MALRAPGSTPATGFEYLVNARDELTPPQVEHRNAPSVLREEVGLERGLKDLRRDVVKAQRQIPKLPAIAARLHAEAHIAKGCVEAELQRELEATKRTVTILGAQQSCFNFNLERTLTGSQTSEVEYQTSEERMIIRHHMHPDAARALREFAAQVIDVPAGTA